jgi:hypothetical protein
MNLLRLSDIDDDLHVLVNPDHVVSVTATQGPRGKQQRAAVLELRLSDGQTLRCFPIDERGGFDSQTDDEAEVLFNFQKAVRWVAEHPELPQGAVY